MNTITIGEFLDNYLEKLQMRWCCGKNGANIILQETNGQEHPSVGPLNLIHPNQIQLIGIAEQDYLDNMPKALQKDSIEQIFITKPTAIIYTQGLNPPQHMIQKAEKHSTPLLCSTKNTLAVQDMLHYELQLLLAERKTLHGVFMEILGIGVLLMGPAASGKSELALELLTRGHRLIADDAPLFARIAPDIITGTCPSVLQDFLEVRGLGLLNIRRMFGDLSIKKGKYLRLIIRLAPSDDQDVIEMDRLMGGRSEFEILGLSIPMITLPIALGRNMAILIETAVRKHILHDKEYDASEEFIDRQRKELGLNKEEQP